MSASEPDDPITPQAFADGCARFVIAWAVGIGLVGLAAKLGPTIGLDKGAAICFAMALWFGGMAWFRIPAVLAGSWYLSLRRILGETADEAVHWAMALTALVAGVGFQVLRR